MCRLVIFGEVGEFVSFANPREYRLMAESSDPIAWLKGLAESSTRIRLAPGVLGKSSILNYGVALAWIVAIFRADASLVLDGFLFGGATLLTLYAMSETKKMREYAVANPSLALMEGADITEHQRFEAQAKGQSSNGDLSLGTDPSRPLLHGPVRGGPEEDD